MPPSASQRPIFDSAELSMNCLPTDLPRSITSLACGLSLAPSEDERFTAGPPSLPAATSGCGISAGEWEPLFPSGSALNMFMPETFGPDPDDELGRSGAPHSSQYCPPSRLEDLHLSQVIMILEVCELHPIRDKFSISVLKRSSATAGHSSAKVFD